MDNLRKALEEIREICTDNEPPVESLLKVYTLAGEALSAQPVNEGVEKDEPVWLLKERLRNQENTIDGFQTGLAKMFDLEQPGLSFFGDFKRLYEEKHPPNQEEGVEEDQEALWKELDKISWEIKWEEDSENDSKVSELDKFRKSHFHITKK